MIGKQESESSPLKPLAKPSLKAEISLISLAWRYHVQISDPDCFSRSSMQTILKGSDFVDFPSIVVSVYIGRGMFGKQDSEQVALSSHWQIFAKSKDIIDFFLLAPPCPDL